MFRLIALTALGGGGLPQYFGGNPRTLHYMNWCWASLCPETTMEHWFSQCSSKRDPSTKKTVGKSHANPSLVTDSEQFLWCHVHVMVSNTHMWCNHNHWVIFPCHFVNPTLTLFYVCIAYRQHDVARGRATLTTPPRKKMAKLSWREGGRCFVQSGIPRGQRTQRAKNPEKKNSEQQKCNKKVTLAVDPKATKK